ncbi:hypothetical protein BZB76_0981 [Actinomadura pelletieri DSM 43383]|uniref:Uncharacterized protein n=1 Tax=Actinomadura pelletieri DSM 43383 TaxID=1120940 RepID=A0A495QZB9_9ACTN|nr:hypothetical protein [Actinomadura pelletieri]RKS79510.1 hypothetical protein BZB76_0981 [Actinomadura pelletieri DSM 43383]
MILLSNVRSEGSDLAHLAAELDIPTIAGLQHQGDVSVIPAAMASRDYQPAVTQVPASGIAVVFGEAGGNTHLLLASGDVRYDAANGAADDITLGSLEVGDGATAWLDHPEHGNTGIAPGRYVLRRKREMAPRVLDPGARRKREQARKQARKQAARDQAIREQAAARQQDWNASVRFVAD